MSTTGRAESAQVYVFKSEDRARAVASTVGDAILVMRALLEVDDTIGFEEYQRLSGHLQELPARSTHEVVCGFSSVMESGPFSLPDAEEIYQAVNAIILSYEDLKNNEKLLPEYHERGVSVAFRKGTTRTSLRTARDELKAQLGQSSREFMNDSLPLFEPLLEQEKPLKDLYDRAKQIDTLQSKNIRKLQLDHKIEGALPRAAMLHARESQIKATLADLHASGNVKQNLVSYLKKVGPLYEELNPFLKQLDAGGLPGYPHSQMILRKAQAYLAARRESIKISRETYALRKERREIEQSMGAAGRTIDTYSRVIDAFKQKMSRQAILEYEPVNEAQFSVAAFDMTYQPLGSLVVASEGMPDAPAKRIDLSFNFNEGVPVCVRCPTGAVFDHVYGADAHCEGDVLYLAGASRDRGYEVRLRVPFSHK